MISQRQFTDALTFIRSYKDALDCVEQIAERRAAYNHYEQLTAQIVEGIQNNQVSVSSGIPHTCTSYQSINHIIIIYLSHYSLN